MKHPDGHWFMRWEPDDWLLDDELTACSPQTRGIWMDWLCRMGRSGGYYVQGDIQTLADLGRCTPEQAEQAVRELRNCRAARVLKHKCGWRIVSRRCHKEWRERKSARIRKMHERGKDVTD